MRMIATVALLMALASGLAACGRDMGTRALSGGAIGAGGGALMGAATGGNAGVGALIGGLGGAAVGAATTPQGRRY
ncbi:cell envelope biogenesis protein OmpA [Granulibacter bethesdensis]|nr:cell envelope biogenesis protein OmpA [Granulibacter bethesdensis]